MRWYGGIFGIACLWITGVAAMDLSWWRYSPPGADYDASAEQVVAGYQSRLDRVSSGISLSQIEGRSYKVRGRLSVAEKAALAEHHAVAPAHAFWKTVVDLKAAIAALDSSLAAQAEAERLAERIVTTLYSLAPSYGTFLSPYLHNLAIRTGVRKRGYCYHYVSDLFKVLRQDTWQYYDLRWAGSRKGTVRESNALAITKKGAPFESGLIVDAWRTGGRPYWHAIIGDQYAWIEDREYYITP